MQERSNDVRFMAAKTRISALLALLMAALVALSLACMSPAKSYASSSVRYVAVFGADTWITQNRVSCDLGLIARIDTKGGTVSFLTIPRDMQYTGYISKKSLGFDNESAPLDTFNSIFNYEFMRVIGDDWNSKTVEGLHAGNYEKAIKAASAKTCTMMKAITGISVTDYVTVDLYTYMDIIDMMGGVKVNLPAPIKDYKLYSDGTYHTVNGGKLGNAVLNAQDAMVASRARVPYAETTYNSLSDYKGNASQIVIKYGGGSYGLSPDGTRQFVDRRTLAMLVNKALDKGGSAWSFAWNSLVGGGLMWTNMSQSDFKSIGNALVKAKKKNKFVVFGSQAIDPLGGGTQTLNGLDQWIFMMEGNTAKQTMLKNTVKQFKAGKYMTAGWGSEAIIGLQKGAKTKVKGVTYKVLNNSDVSVTKIPNKKKVSIPSQVTINGKKYNVTTIAAKSMKGSKVRTVTLGANVKKIASKAFAGSKAKTLVLKTTKLKKSTVKGSLAKSVVKVLKISVDKSKKAKITKRYTKYFAQKNSKSKAELKVK
ncbi:MAG: hypothetical protein E7000_06560 [Coriobacteriaceae bacterium]|nr:hypothetical protein [Coriobacteriaceae bacterium]